MYFIFFLKVIDFKNKTIKFYRELIFKVRQKKVSLHR